MYGHYVSWRAQLTHSNYTMLPSTRTVFKNTLFPLIVCSLLMPGCEKEEEQVPKSSEKVITRFAFVQLSPVVNATIDQSTRQIIATVPATTDLTKLTPSISLSAKAKVLPDSAKAQDFTKPVSYTVTAEDGTKAEYTVSVTRIKLSSKDIVAFSFDEFSPAIAATIDPNARTIIANLPATADLTKLRPTIKLSDRATSDPASGVTTDFSAPVRYRITAEDGSTQVYTAQITRESLAITIKAGRLPGKAVVYVASNGGFELKAVDAETGLELWSYYNAGAASFMNPTVYDGNLIVNSYGVNFIDCATGLVNGTIPNTRFAESSPVVFNDVLYYGSGTDGYLRAFDLKTKKMKWLARADYWVNASPTILNNTLVVSIENGNALKAFALETGTLKWSIDDMRGRVNPCVFDSTIIASSFGEIRAYDVETGLKRWGCTVDNASASSPTISEGIVYVGSASAYAYALNASNGTLKWRVKMGGNIDSSPIVAGDLVYFYCKDSFFYALDKKTGAEKWKFRIGQLANYNDDTKESSPVVVAGVVFIQGIDKVLYALDALTGGKRWQYSNASYQSFSSPCVIDKAGQVYHSGISGMTN